MSPQAQAQAAAEAFRQAPTAFNQAKEIHQSSGSFGEMATSEQPMSSVKPKDEAGNKIGRNDLCFCGSGLKYKKCHGK